MDISRHAAAVITDNIRKIDNPFAFASFRKGQRIRHVSGVFSGTTASGWPFLTTFANTITMIVLGLLVQKRSESGALTIAACGDNIALITVKNDVRKIYDSVRTLTVAKNVSTTRGLGLIIPEINFTLHGTTFLSKVYYYRDCFIREASR